MKKILLITFLLFCISVLGGQRPLVHLGTENEHPIGNKDISAKVYLLFLKEKATGEEYSYLHFSKYCEYSFMDTKRFSCNMSCIKQRTVWSTERKCYYYDYSMILGHENDIIDALSSRDTQREFNLWYADWLLPKDPSNDSLNAPPTPTDNNNL